MHKYDDSDIKKYLESDELKKDIIDDLDRLAKENKFNSLEKVKKIHLTTEMFTPENEILTPSMKIKRPFAKKVYLAEIEKMYGK